jgi:hypothetical protein
LRITQVLKSFSTLLMRKVYCQKGRKEWVKKSPWKRCTPRKL